MSSSAFSGKLVFRALVAAACLWAVRTEVFNISLHKGSEPQEVDLAGAHEERNGTSVVQLGAHQDLGLRWWKGTGLSDALLEVWSVNDDPGYPANLESPEDGSDPLFPKKDGQYTMDEAEPLAHLVMTIIWCTVCASTMVAVCCCPAPSRTDLIEELVAEIHRLLSATQAKAADDTKGEEMGAAVGGLQESFSSAASRFKEFMTKLQDNPSCLGGDEADTALAPSLGMLVSQWFAVFSECTKDPAGNPLTVVGQQEIIGCDTVSKICALVLSKMEGVTLDITSGNPGFVGQGGCMDLLLSPFKEEDEDQLQRVLGGPNRRNTWFTCCGCNRFYNEDPVRKSGAMFPLRMSMGIARCSVLTCRHFMLFFLFFGGMALSTFMLLTDLWCAIACIVGLAFILILLLRFELLDASKQQRYVIAQLQVRKSVLKKAIVGQCKQQEKEASGDNSAERIVKFWTCRTLPMLTVLKAIFAVIRSTRWSSCDACKEFVDFVSEAIESQQSQIGDVTVWLGEAGAKEKKGSVSSPGVLSLKAFDLFKDEFDRCSLFLQSSGYKAIIANRSSFNVLNFVAVRVVGARSLPPGNYLDPIEPYVRMRIGSGNDPEDWLQTPPIEMTVDPDNTEERLNPKWHSETNTIEFHMNATTEIGMPLELEVMDVNDHGDDETVGVAEYKYEAASPGQWNKGIVVTLNNIEPLFTPEKDSEVELEIWYASTASHLVGITPMEPEPPQEPMPGRGVSEVSSSQFDTGAADEAAEAFADAAAAKDAARPA
eukprot:TRINITY_DN44027_c0_g1_i1.p1 TRINITY_DN44027_c0_g1~~TRINITY_DN44027_c0_g1_i1.p1  ORF type:complete len:768 (+),score=170.21 TRINITY_DN44027_c0_g1_i1:32-2335(+)